MKKWNSRKLLALVASYAISSYLLSRGIDVDPSAIQDGFSVIAENGMKGAIGLGQLWLTKKYIDAQAKIDALEKSNELLGD